MSFSSNVTESLADTLKPIARQLGSRLGNIIGHQSLIDASSTSLTQQIRQEPRWVQAQLQYLRRKNARSLELIAINPNQEDRINQLKEEDNKDRQEISRLYRDLIQQQQAVAINLKLQEMQNIWDKDTWFSNLSRQETEQILQVQKHRLLLLVSPAKMSEDCPDSFRYNLNLELPAKLRTFLSENYPQHSDTCPVQFYGDYFKHPISDIDVERLQQLLAPIPSAIIYSNISDYEVNFNIGFWLANDKNASLIPLPSWNWETAYEQLEKSGVSSKQSLRIVRQIMVYLHQLLAAFIADLYYIGIDFNYQPQFYSLDANCNEEWLSVGWLNPYREVLQEIQKKQQGAYEREMRRLAVQEARMIGNRPQRDQVEQRRSEAVFLEAQKRRQLEVKLNSQQWQCQHTLSGHSSFVNTVAISPDGRVLASGSWDTTIKLWDLQSGELLTTLAGHDDRVNSVSITPNGELIITGSFDETIKIWELSTGNLLQTITGHSMGVNSVAISPKGPIIASCGGEDNTIKIWNLETGKMVKKIVGHTGDVNSVVFSPDGNLLASGSSDCTNKIWDVNTGELLRTLSGLRLGVNSLAISPDGEILVSMRYDYTIKLRNLHTGALLRILNNASKSSQQNTNGGKAWHILRNHACRGNSVAIAPDGTTLVSGSDDNNVKLWNLRSGELINNLTGHTGTVYAVAIAPQGNIIVSGSSDETIKIWQYN